MSGGHFDYNQHRITEIADEIQRLVDENNDQSLNEWGEPVGLGFSADTIEQFENAVQVLQLAHVFAQRIDWLMSGDDGEETFHQRLEKDLTELLTNLEDHTTL